MVPGASQEAGIHVGRRQLRHRAEVGEDRAVLAPVEDHGESGRDRAVGDDPAGLDAEVAQLVAHEASEGVLTHQPGDRGPQPETRTPGGEDRTRAAEREGRALDEALDLSESWGQVGSGEHEVGIELPEHQDVQRLGPTHGCTEIRASPTWECRPSRMERSLPAYHIS